jgi:hypothetical protein
MPLLGVHAVLALQNPERKYLQKVDEAIHDALFASTMAASANKLDADLVGKATATLLLVAAVREAKLSCERANTTFDFREFCDLAAETAAWMLTRSRASHASALN